MPRPKDEIVLTFRRDGGVNTVETPWWNKDVHIMLMEAGFTPAEGYEKLNENPYCG